MTRRKKPKQTAAIDENVESLASTAATEHAAKRQKLHAEDSSEVGVIEDDGKITANPLPVFDQAHHSVSREANRPNVDASVLCNYNVRAINVISSNKISKRVHQIFEHLQTHEQKDSLSQPLSNGRQRIVHLHANHRVASKLISIVEIARREATAKELELFQYTKLESKQLVPVTSTIEDGPLSNRGNGRNDKVSDEIVQRENRDKRPKAHDDGSEDSAFESMTIPEAIRKVTESSNIQREKSHPMPILSVFLTLQSVKELREAYSEQT